MSNFSPERLFVKFRNGIKETKLTFPRKYTLTHSDITNELFLTIRTEFALDKINFDMSDEVLGEWILYGGSLYFNVYVYIDRQDQDFNVALKLDKIFRRELPLALTAIRYGNRSLFDQYPFLDSSYIIINFVSSFPD